MSQLRSMITELTSFDPNDLTVEELAAEITELLHGQQLLEVAVTGWVKNLSGRGSHVEPGYPSPTSFLTDQGRLGAGHAKQVVSRGNAATKAPAAFRAWADGRLSTDQASQVFRLAEAVPDEFPQAEETLVETVEGLTVPDTQKVLEYWRQSVDGPSELDPETQMTRRGVSLSKTLGGMRRIDGWLTQQAGEALETALEAIMGPPTDDDTRTPRQRRHDALENLSRDWLDHGDTPTVGGEKPNITLLTDLDALGGIAGGTHETLNGDIIDVDTLRQLACDCSVTRIILGPNSEILDVGRKTRVWTPAQRRAITARDRHCTAKGCRTKPQWCDIHHETHWADGGDTNLDQGRLLCRFHHTHEHTKQRTKRRTQRQP